MSFPRTFSGRLEGRLRIARNDGVKTAWQQLSSEERARALVVDLGSPPAEDRLLALLKSLGDAKWTSMDAALENERAKTEAGLDDIRLRSRIGGKGELCWQLCARGPLLTSTGMETIRQRGSSVLGSHRLRQARSLQGMFVKAERSWAHVGALIYLALELRWCAYVEEGVPIDRGAPLSGTRAKTRRSRLARMQRHSVAEDEPNIVLKDAELNEPNTVLKDAELDEPNTVLKEAELDEPNTVLKEMRLGDPLEEQPTPAPHATAPETDPARCSYACVCGADTEYNSAAKCFVRVRWTFVHVSVCRVKQSRKRSASFPGTPIAEELLYCSACGEVY